MKKNKTNGLTPEGRVDDKEEFLKSSLCECHVAIDCCQRALVMVDKITGEDMYGYLESGVLVWYTKDNIPAGYKK